MDQKASNAEVINSARIVDPVLRLKRIDPVKWAPERLEWLWQKVKEEKYSHDDAGEDNAAMFLANLFAPCTEHYEYGDDAYICVLNLLAGVNADIHFCLWGDVPTRDIYPLHRYIVQHLIEEWNIHRMTAYIPTFNQQARRLTLLLGYKWEGCAREMFLQNGKHYDLEMYGLLRSDFERKRGV